MTIGKAANPPGRLILGSAATDKLSAPTRVSSKDEAITGTVLFPARDTVSVSRTSVRHELTGLTTLKTVFIRRWSPNNMAKAKRKISQPEKS
jgi:hypothetical protein